MPRADVLAEEDADDNLPSPPQKVRRDRNPEVDFRGERHSNATHFSTTDGNARLARKSGVHEAHLACHGHVLMDNRNGLVCDVLLTHATGKAEREVALKMLARRGNRRSGNRRRVTLGADKGYDEKQFVRDTRALNVTPHVARKQFSAINGRVTRHEGYGVSQRNRKRVEEIFGWMKTVGVMQKTRHIGLEKVSDIFLLTAAAYNLVRIRNLTCRT